MESTVELFCGCLFVYLTVLRPSLNGINFGIILWLFICVFDSFEAVFEWNQLLNYFVVVYLCI